MSMQLDVRYFECCKEWKCSYATLNASGVALRVQSLQGLAQMRSISDWCPMVRMNWVDGGSVGVWIALEIFNHKEVGTFSSIWNYLGLKKGDICHGYGWNWCELAAIDLSPYNIFSRKQSFSGGLIHAGTFFWTLDFIDGMIIDIEKAKPKLKQIEDFSGAIGLHDLVDKIKWLTFKWLINYLGSLQSF